MLIKRNASGNITDVVINESKQFRSDGSIKLSDAIQGQPGSPCSNCTQMSDAWIDDVIIRMRSTSNSNTVNLGNELRNFKRNNTIQRSVSAVNRTTGDLTIVKL